MPSSSTSFSCTRCAQPSHSRYSRSSRSASMRILSLRTRTGISPFFLSIVRTVLRLSWSRRAISRALMPSWWSRNTAWRLCASIMESPQAVEKGSLLAQDPGRQHELRTNLLKLHELAMAVVNNGSRSQASKMFDLAMNLDEQVGHMMNELAQVQDTLAKLVALYPDSLSYADLDDAD